MWSRFFIELFSRIVCFGFKIPKQVLVLYVKNSWLSVEETLKSGKSQWEILFMARFFKSIFTYLRTQASVGILKDKDNSFFSLKEPYLANLGKNLTTHREHSWEFSKYSVIYP